MSVAVLVLGCSADEDPGRSGDASAGAGAGTTGGAAGAGTGATAATGGMTTLGGAGAGGTPRAGAPSQGGDAGAPSQGGDAGAPSQGGDAGAQTAAGAGGTSGGSSSDGGAAAAGGQAGAPNGPRLVLPALVALPFVTTGAGGSTANAEVGNVGDRAFSSLAFSIEGTTSLHIASAPSALAAGASSTAMIRYDGAAVEEIVTAELVVTYDGGSQRIPIYAVAGRPELGASTWAPYDSPSGTHLGTGTTTTMPAAPFPSEGAPFTDDSVAVFLPEGYRDRGEQDLVVHFHGWNTTVATHLAAHSLREQLWASGANEILVVPQGPVNAASGNFGKLMAPGGLAAFVRETLIVLYRDGRIQAPVLGHVTLTAHDGGYLALAANLTPESLAPPVSEVHLFDALNASEPFAAFATGGGRLRSNYSPAGGTATSNVALASSLATAGLTVATTPTQTALRDERVVIYAADTTHAGTTRLNGAFGEQLRWSQRASCRGPRLELLSAIAGGETATVRWRSPVDEDVTGFAVEWSGDGQTWEVAATATASQSEASFPIAASGDVRVRSLIPGLETLPSDVYHVAPSPRALVVDAFDRVVGGSFGGLQHAFAARVGAALGAVASASNEAVTDGVVTLDPTDWPVVVWLAGDEAAADEALSPAELELLAAYVQAGGVVVMSGSELAYTLAPSASGPTFLAEVFGASYAGDDSGSYEVAGAGALSALGAFTFGGPGSPYPEEYPDYLAPTGAGEGVLQYASGTNAAVGIAGSGVLVGFPLELVDDDAALATTLQALTSYARGE